MWLPLMAIALVQLTAGVSAQSPAAPLRIVGEYSNIKFTGEHAYGYTVQLWQQGDRLFGFLESSDGLAGDTPIGTLDEVQYDRRNGSLSFRAKLTMGMALLAQGREEPSRDLFEFRGTLKRAALTGTITRQDMLRPQVKPKSGQVRLPKQSDETMIEAQTYAEWKTLADQLLKFRGPKW
jgi:hypothetical protein